MNDPFGYLRQQLEALWRAQASAQPPPRRYAYEVELLTTGEETEAVELVKPQLTLAESEEFFVVQCAVPGLPPQDIQAYVDNDTICLSGILKIPSFPFLGEPEYCFFLIRMYLLTPLVSVPIVEESFDHTLEVILAKQKTI